MVRRLVIAVFLLALVGPVRAADAPEDLLPAGTQLYVRWDGTVAHKDAYAKTALGKMLAGDTGKFVSGVFNQMQDTVGGLLTVQSLLGGAAPEKLQKLQADATEATKLLPLLGQNGFIFAVEARGLEPPDGQVTIILPNIGDNSKPFLGLLRLIAGVADLEIKEQKIEERAVSHIQAGPVQAAWWIEGKHGVVTGGTMPPEAVVKRMTGSGDKLTGNPLFKKVQSFNQFETGARAFLDVAAIAKIARTRGADVAKLIEDLGLDNLRSLTFYSGFDGEAERGLTELDVEGPRKGLLRLTTGKTFKLADVPPIPDDVVSWSMTNFDTVTLYDVGVKTAEHIVKLVSPDDLPKVKEILDQADKLVGVNIRNDLLGNLDGQVLHYNSPAEGPFTLGQTFLLKVKDADKVQAALEQAIKGIGQATGADVSIKKKKYRGVELREVHVRQQGFFFKPTYAVHKDWLVVGYFPQQVHGYILRATGEVPSWKPGPHLQAAFDKLPKEFVSVSVSDPRPTVKQFLSIAPIIGGAIDSFLPDVKFDVSTLPNAHEATRHLFPNVSVASDDGKRIRQETRASLALPIDVTGLDLYVVGLGLGFVTRAVDK
jgi:hypothetical protein